MKHLLLVMLVAAVVVRFAVLVSANPDNGTASSSQESEIDAQLVEGVGVYAIAPPSGTPSPLGTRGAPSPPESLAQLSFPDPCATCTEVATAETMEQNRERYRWMSASEVLANHLSPPCEIREVSAVLKSDPVSVRDHAPC